MNNLSLVSFVGVDLRTNFEDLLSFHNKNIKYEFGVLYSDSKNGLYQRYPDYKFSERFLRWCQNNKVNSSLHLCGTSIDKFLNEEDIIMNLCLIADRIQLNINIKKYDNFDILSDNILKISKKNNYSIILQDNQTKKRV